MQISSILKSINKLVGNDSSFTLNYEQLKIHLNTAVDQVNSFLKTNMLTIEEGFEKAHDKDSALLINNYDYTEMPDSVIRSVVVYYAAASYLEEEDEFESQYKAYVSKADNALVNIRNTYYGVYDCNW